MAQNNSHLFLITSFIFKGDDLETALKRVNVSTFLSDMSDKSITSPDCLSKEQLKTLCNKQKLRKSGNKEVLKARVLDYYSTNELPLEVRKCFC